MVGCGNSRLLESPSKFIINLGGLIMEEIKVLLAEDHTVVRESIREFLSKQEDLVVVGEAADGVEAIELTKKLCPDVVVIDLAMPTLGGIAATKEIKQSLPATRVLVLSAYDYDEYVFACLEAGAAGYLLKDVTGQQLVDAIRTVHRGDSILHPMITRRVIEEFRERSKPSGTKPKDFLTEGEKVVLTAVAKGLANKDIARQLHLSTRTVEARLANIFNKLGVRSRTEAVTHALKAGWLTLEDIP